MRAKAKPEREPTFISYLRVSTAKQGVNGLGMEAQRAAVDAYLAGRKLLREYVEQETGKNDDRVELANAIHHAQVTGSTLVVAKLDRLSRNAAFLLRLRDSGVKFVCADCPEANDLTIGVLAIVAQNEREMISKRTKAALAAAKSRGQKLGNDNSEALKAMGYCAPGRLDGANARREQADQFANRIKMIISDIQSGGITSLNGIARELERRGIETPLGGTWTATSVRNMMARNSRG